MQQQLECRMATGDCWRMQIGLNSLRMEILFCLVEWVVSHLLPLDTSMMCRCDLSMVRLSTLRIPQHATEFASFAAFQKGETKAPRMTFIATFNVLRIAMRSFSQHETNDSRVSERASDQVSN